MAVSAAVEPRQQFCASPQRALRPLRVMTVAAVLSTFEHEPMGRFEMRVARPARGQQRFERGCLQMFAILPEAFG